ncbi:hypothetical protein APR04_003902 [Promicromonospora umidemergens]|uniref:Uncharacterized protein n=2 Tax=Promicromonospora TaxID=43676 RepID=A0ABP8XIG0_9MICO|nr:hypothetical protein [Promicromonospora umidemergens]MCP2284979.1 hypothetical protein [Promicromonospora umidemergens]
MNSTTTPGPTMTRATYDRAWARSVIGYWSHVRVRDIDTEFVTLTFGQDVIKIIQLTVTATSTRDAHRLALLLDLPPEAPNPAHAWQTWTGWVSDISNQCAVLVRVTAPIGSTTEAS